MGQHTDRARTALLDAAEELFARHGIDAVSNRRIAEHAGSANHSAVGYHFGTRDDLIRALLLRHTEAMGTIRRQLVDQLGPRATTRDIIGCRLLPLVRVLDSLPQPSWRARFLAQMRTVPSAATVMKSVSDELEIVADINSVRAKADGVPDAVINSRSALLAHLVLGVCADYEAQVQDGTHRGNWTEVGWFLIDAAAGLLSAPVTHPDARFEVPDGPSLI